MYRKMKINQNTKIVTKNVVLVPYEDFHVPKYHEWMKSKELQELTASEPLSLLEEYAMQRSWREDDDKCTFIILDRLVYEHSLNEIESMIGDTNLFFNSEAKHEAEIEIMIAEKSARGKGYGWESTLAMLYYGIENLGVTIYKSKISINNEISIKMFTKLGFEETERSEVFNEVTLEKHVTSEWKDWIKSFCNLNITDYIENKI